MTSDGQNSVAAIVRYLLVVFFVLGTGKDESPTWSASLRVVVSGFALTASKIWEPSLPLTALNISVYFGYSLCIDVI
jgi:hypothetical protein